jgi:hypothetical protein
LDSPKVNHCVGLRALPSLSAVFKLYSTQTLCNHWSTKLGLNRYRNVLVDVGLNRYKRRDFTVGPVIGLETPLLLFLFKVFEILRRHQGGLKLVNVLGDLSHDGHLLMLLLLLLWQK